jgi:hypothetical protein
MTIFSRNSLGLEKATMLRLGGEIRSPIEFGPATGIEILRQKGWANGGLSFFNQRYDGSDLE